MTQADPKKPAPPRAWPLLAAAVAASAAMVVALYGAGHAYARLGDPLLETLAERLGEPVMWEGMRREAAGDYAGAIARYQDALEGHFEGLHHRAWTLKQLGTLLAREVDPEEGLPHLRASIDTGAEPITVYYALAETLRRLERYEECTQVVRRWLEKAERERHDLQQAKALYYAGVLARLRGAEDAARKHFEHSLALNPAGTGALALAELHNAAGDTTQALHYIDRFLLEGAPENEEELQRAHTLRQALLALRGA